MASGDFTEFFTELMYGSGSWIGLLLMLGVILLLAKLHKYGYALSFPLSILISLNYVEHTLLWESVISFLTGLLVLLGGAYSSSKD